ncbi:MAG TPA: hypothetical protein VFL13_07490 [Candidatus Baltobacteraceae bacterium]|nr:hypothetical protein [Candidatus Baltobacteraceae bacterium]
MWAALRRSRVAILFVSAVAEALVATAIVASSLTLLELTYHRRTIDWWFIPYFIWHVAIGRWGHSLSNTEPVLTAIVERLLPSIELFTFTLALVAIATFAISAIRNRRISNGVAVLICAASSVPFFVSPFAADYVAATRHLHSPLADLVLPGFVSAIALFWDFNRSYRAEAKRTPLGAFVRSTARELPRFIAVLGIVELFFPRPGVGRLFHQGLGQQDYPLIAGAVLFAALLSVAARFAAGVLTGDALEPS